MVCEEFKIVLYPWYKAVWELSYSKIKYYLCKEHLGKKKENDINRRTDGGIRREAIV